MDHWIKDLKRGLAAGALALVISFLLRVYAGAVFLPELAALTLFSSVPGEIQSQAVENLGVLAKYSSFLGAIVINLILYGLVGAGLLRVKAALFEGRYVPKSFLFSLAAYALFASLSLIFIFTTEILTQPAPLLSTTLMLLPPHLAFGFTLGVPMRQPQTTGPLACEPVKPGAMDLRRRIFIKRGVTAAAALAILIVGLNSLFNQPERAALSPRAPSTASPLTGPFKDLKLSRLVSSEITPNDQFFNVHGNVFYPVIRADEWRLKVEGSVKNPLDLSYDEVTSMPGVEQYTTLECVSNEIAGDLIGNANWRGVPLRRILEKAEVNGDAVYVVFKCHDNYSVGIPLDKALTDGTILAYEMNGERLPEGHGFPLRAIVPGIYGMMNAKWITEIEVVDAVYEGFWQQRGWSNDATIQTTSVVKYPSHLQMVNGATPIAGIAFTGDRGVSKVEVSTDGGKTWTEAMLKDPLSEYTWVLWAIEWIPPENGAYEITVRATDRSGKVQTAQISRPFPDGATGYHTLDVKVNVDWLRS